MYHQRPHITVVSARHNFYTTTDEKIRAVSTRHDFCTTTDEQIQVVSTRHDFCTTTDEKIRLASTRHDYCTTTDERIRLASTKHDFCTTTDEKNTSCLHETRFLYNDRRKKYELSPRDTISVQRQTKKIRVVSTRHDFCTTTDERIRDRI